MSDIPEIRHRLRVVEDTRKITRAMYLISSAKMRKALRMQERNSAYFKRPDDFFRPPKLALCKAAQNKRKNGVN